MNKQRSLTKIVWNFNKEASQIIKQLLQADLPQFTHEVNLGRSSRGGQDLVLQNHNDYLNLFWLNVALCHDVISTKSNSGNITY